MRTYAEIHPDDIFDIRQSGLFDEAWYLENFPDVKILGMDPIEHFLWVGAWLGRNPSPRFDVRSYLREYDDVGKANINPLLHYIRWGKAERRDSFPAPALRSAGEDSIIAEIKSDRLRNTEVKELPIVVYETHNLKMQGAPNSLFEIASGIKKSGKYQPIMTSNSAGPLSELYQARGIPYHIHSISQNRMKDSKNREKFISKLAQYYEMLRADIIHVNTLQNFHAVLAAHRIGCRVLWNIRESEDPATYYDYMPMDVRDLAYNAINIADAIVFVADSTRRQWEVFWGREKQSYTIHNGISMERIMKPLYGSYRSATRARYCLTESDVVILNVATVSARKGQADLMQALRLIDKNTMSRVVVAIVGFNGSEYSNGVRYGLNELTENGLRTILIDESQNERDRHIVSELYQIADAFVLCSRLESYPRVILEALGFGLPVISTPCFGVKEQLIDGISGLLYGEGSPEILAEHITRIVNDKPFRLTLADGGRKRLKQLNSYANMIRDYERIYDSLI